MNELLTCAVDTARIIWCALPADISLLAPLEPMFIGSLDMLRLVMLR